MKEKDRIMKSYQEFVNEGVGSFLKGIKDFFVKSYDDVRIAILKTFSKHRWYYTGVYLTSKGVIDNNLESSPIKFYQHSSTPEEVKKYVDEIDNKVKILKGDFDVDDLKKEMNSFINDRERYSKINEDVVKQEIPARYGIKDYSATEIRQNLIDIFKNKEEKGRYTAPLIWGAPGISKTASLRQVADELGCELIVCHLSYFDPADFKGIPEIIENELAKDEDPKYKKRTTFRLTTLFPTTNGPKSKGAILFFDEINRAKQSVLNACLGLILDGKMDDYVLPSKVITVAACNREEDDPSLEELNFLQNRALMNRFKHMNMVLDIDEWSAWATTPKAGKEMVDDTVVSFLRFNKEFFHLNDPQEGGAAFPTPRSWTLASDEYMRKREREKRELTKKEVDNIFSSYVGTKASAQFADFWEVKMTYPIDKIAKLVFNNPTEALKSELPEGIAKKKGIIAMISTYDLGKPFTEKELDNYYEFVSNAFTDKELISAAMAIFVSYHRDELKDKKLAEHWVKINQRFLSEKMKIKKPVK